MVEEYKGIGGDTLRDYGGQPTKRDQFFLQLGRKLNRPLLILDAGAGSADLSIEIAKSNPYPRFICTDLESKNLQIARRAAALAGVDHRFNFIHCSATHIPLAPHSVDLAFACSVFSYCEQPLKAISRFYELCKPSGIVTFDVAIESFNPDSKFDEIGWVHNFHYFTNEEVLQIAQLPGLVERISDPPVEIFKFEVPNG